MGDKTGIEWADATWNPIAGCSLVSKGCTNCYAMKMAGRLEAMAVAHMAKHGGDPGPLGHYLYTTEGSRAGSVWTGRVNLAPNGILTQPLRWKRPRRIFVNSMSDLFHENVDFEAVDRIFAVMALTPQHTYKILTKRPERMREYLQKTRGYKIAEAMIELPATPQNVIWESADDTPELETWPLPNIWLGVSVEDQQSAKRIAILLDTPAAIRFISAEPLLGPLEIPNYLKDLGPKCDALDWVIAGGESGPGARPVHPDWLRSLRDQCASAGVPFFFKQWGEYVDFETLGESWNGLSERAQENQQFLNGRAMIRVGKTAAGNHLDGKQHLEFPKERAA